MRFLPDTSLAQIIELKHATNLLAVPLSEAANQQLFEQFYRPAAQNSIRLPTRSRQDLRHQLRRLAYRRGDQVHDPKAQRGIRFREFPDQLVASVTFDPEKVSPRVVYYGLEGWLEWGEDREYKSAGTPREVYKGDPWRSARAWANVEVQVPVKKLR